MEMPPFINTILLFLLNSLVCVGLLYFRSIREDQRDIHDFIKSTRKKLDEHVENFDMHGLVRPDQGG